MPSVAELLRDQDGLPGENPRRDLEILLGHCLARSRSWLYTWPENEVAGSALDRFADLRERRCRGEPVAHLTGQREFWSLTLKVDASTLIPRPETESLVEWALQLSLPDAAEVLLIKIGGEQDVFEQGVEFIDKIDRHLEGKGHDLFVDIDVIKRRPWLHDVLDFRVGLATRTTLRHQGSSGKGQSRLVSRVGN